MAPIKSRTPEYYVSLSKILVLNSELPGKAAPSMYKGAECGFQDLSMINTVSSPFNFVSHSIFCIYMLFY